MVLLFSKLQGFIIKLLADTLFPCEPPLSPQLYANGIILRFVLKHTSYPHSSRLSLRERLIFRQSVTQTLSRRRSLSLCCVRMRAPQGPKDKKLLPSDLRLFLRNIIYHSFLHSPERSTLTRVKLVKREFSKKSLINLKLQFLLLTACT